MTTAIRFEVPGQPVAKQRARTVTRGKGGKPLPFARTYTPSKTVNYESLVALSAQHAMQGRDLMEGPLSVTLTFWMTIPSSWSAKRQYEAQENAIRPTKKPDLDNMTKAVLDACNKIVWRDDSQIVVMFKTKRYSSMPRVEVYVEKISGRPAP